jgi:hypothetical protein
MADVIATANTKGVPFEQMQDPRVPEEVSTLDHRLPPTADLGKVQGHFHCPTPLGPPHTTQQACWDDCELEGRISSYKIKKTLRQKKWALKSLLPSS